MTNAVEIRIKGCVCEREREEARERERERVGQIVARVTSSVSGSIAQGHPDARCCLQSPLHIGPLNDEWFRCRGDNATPTTHQFAFELQLQTASLSEHGGGAASNQPVIYTHSYCHSTFTHLGLAPPSPAPLLRLRVFILFTAFLMQECGVLSV